MLIPKKIIQTKLNEAHNISYEDLVKFFAIRKSFGHIKDPASSRMTSLELADECLKVTEGADETVPDNPDFEFDPLHNYTKTSFYYSNLKENGEKFGEDRLRDILNDNE